jgi:hypothetical protein
MGLLIVSDFRDGVLRARQNPVLRMAYVHRKGSSPANSLGPTRCYLLHDICYVQTELPHVDTVNVGDGIMGCRSMAIEELLRLQLTKSRRNGYCLQSVVLRAQSRSLTAQGNTVVGQSLVNSTILQVRHR